MLYLSFIWDINETQGNMKRHTKSILKSVGADFNGAADQKIILKLILQ